MKKQTKRSTPVLQINCAIFWFQFSDSPLNFPAGRSDRHGSAIPEHQTSWSQTDRVQTDWAQTPRAGPGRDLEEGLPVSVVQDVRQRLLVPAAAQRWRLSGRETKQRRRRGEQHRQRGLGHKRCLSDWSQSERYARLGESKAFAGGTSRRGLGPPLWPLPGRRTAADRCSTTGTLKDKTQQLPLGRLLVEVTSNPFWSALYSETLTLLLIPKTPGRKKWNKTETTQGDIMSSSVPNCANNFIFS